MTSIDSYSKFEKVRILSARSLQLSQGAPPMIEVPPSVKRPLDIAKLELEADMIPIEIRRREFVRSLSAKEF